MSRTRGDKSSSYDGQTHYKVDIPREHNYFYGEFESRYMPIGLANTYVMWLQDKHRLDDFFFPGIVSVFRFNKYFNYITLKVLYIYVIIF
jgi:hypothetical protein